MRNTYEISVRARCPVDPKVRDAYHFVIESEVMIEVAAIVAFFKAATAGRKGVFQEDLTAKCAAELGASVVSVGWHSGVKVTSSAP